MGWRFRRRCENAYSSQLQGGDLGLFLDVLDTSSLVLSNPQGWTMTAESELPEPGR